MTRLAQVLFGLLVAASFAAFFVAQELKSQPSVIQNVQIKHRVFSPNGDGRFDAQRVTFRLKRADTADVAIVDGKGDVVRELASGVSLGAYEQLKPSLRWDGRAEDGRLAPDGTYRVRITLREEGRTATIRRAFRLDTTPPRPRIRSIGPERGAGPELLPRPDGDPARIRLAAPAKDGRLLVFRMWPRPPRLVREIPLADGQTLADWDGTDDAGRRLAPAPYLVVAETRDAAGNIGTSVPLDRRGLPQQAFGRTLPGRGGITIRDLAIQPPLLPVRAGRRVTFGVDARGRPYRWAIRDAEGEVVRRGRARRPLVRVTAPGRASGAFLFEVRRGARSASVPFAVDDRARHRILVVLPAMTWQGRNPVDDDGDGQPDLLADGLDVRLQRVIGVPRTPGWGDREGPVMAWLAEGRRRFDVTTDVALAVGAGPRLAGHAGVLLPGDTVWLPPRLQRDLRRFVTRGGTLASAGVGSLQRQARLTPRLRLVNPTPPATTDIFGSRLAPLRRGPVTLTIERDAIDLFADTEGLFRGFDAIEQTRSTGPAALLSSAVTEDGRVVIVALRAGRGTVIRFGLPQLPSRLAGDPDVQGLMERTWRLLSR